jgi:integrase
MPRQRENFPPLTKRIVDGATPQPKRYLLFDGLVHGFALKVEPTGAKRWIVQKSQRGRSIRIPLGASPDLSVEQARRAAQAVVADLASGRDLAAEKRAAVTVNDVWARYTAEVVALNKASTAREKARMWKARVEPAIGRTPVREVSDTELSAIVRAPLRLDAKGCVTGGRGEAGNLYRLLHHLFAKALVWRLRPLELGHPLDGVDQPRVNRRERLLSDAEVTSLWGALARSAGREAQQALDAIRFVLLSGWRATEALALQREHVQADVGEARLPDSKSGHSVRPLSTEALAVLAAIKRRPGVPWFFAGIEDPSKPLSYNSVRPVFARIAQRAGLVGVTLHTLRHRVVTDLAGAAPNLRTGMSVSGHKSVTAFMAYVHAERERAQHVAGMVGSRIAALAQQPAENVIELALPHRRGRRCG